jgi:hypothetical protein
MLNKTEVTGSSEMLVPIHQFIRCYNTDRRDLHNRRRVSVKSHTQRRWCRCMEIKLSRSNVCLAHFRK